MSDGINNGGDLNAQTCGPCQGGMAALDADQARILWSQLHADWTINADSTELRRRLEFKGYAKAVYHANLAAFLSDQEGHHADVSFGWGYCDVMFCTHVVGGLTENDFICAAKFDRLVAPA